MGKGLLVYSCFHPKVEYDEGTVVLRYESVIRCMNLECKVFGVKHVEVNYGSEVFWVENVEVNKFTAVTLTV